MKNFFLIVGFNLIFNLTQAQQTIGFFNGMGYDLKLIPYKDELNRCFINNSVLESDQFLISRGKVVYFTFNNEINDCSNTILFRLGKSDQIDSSFLGYNPNAINILKRIEYKFVAKDTFLYLSLSGYPSADIILSIGQSGF
jgi:hypothetical protein